MRPHERATLPCFDRPEACKPTTTPQERESASLQSESQTPTRGQTNATRRKQAKGGKAERRSKGEEKGEHRRKKGKKGKKERTRERDKPAAGHGNTQTDEGVREDSSTALESQPVTRAPGTPGFKPKGIYPPA